MQTYDSIIKNALVPKKMLKKIIKTEEKKSLG